MVMLYINMVKKTVITNAAKIRNSILTCRLSLLLSLRDISIISTPALQLYYTNDCKKVKSLSLYFYSLSAKPIVLHSFAAFSLLCVGAQWREPNQRAQ
jgi:hypothetical protein